MGARESALRVLIACRTKGAWADAALPAQIERDALTGADAALCSRLTYGVMQNEYWLDHCLGAFCSQPIGHLQPPLADILRLGAYQILFLDKIPVSAAVNESVNLAKRFRREAAAGLVNAVLRKLAQNKETLSPIERKDAVSALSVRYSHPKWLVKRLLKTMGAEETEAFLAADNEIAPICVQVNPLKTTAEELIEELRASGVDARVHAWVPDCLELRSAGDVRALPPFREGKFLVQDGAARLVSLFADCKGNQRVLDLCAAPGGKSFSAAFAMQDCGEIVACDLYENKLRRMEDGATRLGVTCIETLAADGRTYRVEWAEAFDTVLVDAPCSGIGIIRKKPDIRYKKADDLFTLPVLQGELLENASRYVKRGGILVYSTCTVFSEENEQVTDEFLSRHENFIRERVTLPPPVGEVSDGQLTLLPHRHGTDGFYICRMRRQ